MFGAGVPVCAINYEPALSELVVDNKNGCVFKNSDQLSRIILRLLFGVLENCELNDLRNIKSCFPVGSEELSRLQRGVRSSIKSWEQNWNEIMPNIVHKLTSSETRLQINRRGYINVVGVILAVVFAIIIGFCTSYIIYFQIKK